MNKRSIVAGTAVAAVLLGVTAPAAAVGRASATPVAARPVGRVPTVVDPGSDLGSQPAGDGPTWADSVYVTGHVRAGGHEFGYLVHVLALPNVGVRRQSVTVTDKTTGWYRTHTVNVPAEAFHWDSDKLDVRTGDLTWTGNADRQRITARTPYGPLDITLDASGPVMYYAGTGLWEMLGFAQHEYALPQMSTRGALTADGRPYQVTGTSWLDRQWGALPDLTADRWSWFNFAMPQGDKIALWDIVSGDGSRPEETWATILHPDGTHELVPATPIAEKARRYWTSPTGQVFPTQWTISIPSRNTRLTVTTTSPAQEAPAPTGSIYEGAAAFVGTYDGRRVSGQTYAEMVGDWTP